MLARSTEVIVVGAGPAGSTAAMRLAEAGRTVLLMEKESAPHHKVCGEFLSQESVAYLRSCGVEPLELGAVPIHSLRLCLRPGMPATRLPFSAMSLSRRVLDEALIKRAEAAGSIIRRSAFATRIDQDGDAWRVSLRGGETLRAASVFLATGKHDLSGWARPDCDSNQLVGFKLHWKVTQAQTEALRNHVEVFFFSGGYGGISLVEEDTANLCLVVRSPELRRKGGWKGLFEHLLHANPHLRLRFGGGEATWDRPLAISSIPYGFTTATRSPLWHLGDQAAVIPSFTGEGMSIALHSAALASAMYVAGDGPSAYHRRLKRELRFGMSLANLTSRAMFSDSARALASFCLPAFPEALRWIAASTRIPSHLLRTSRIEQPLISLPRSS